LIFFVGRIADLTGVEFNADDSMRSGVVAGVVVSPFAMTHCLSRLANYTIMNGAEIDVAYVLRRWAEQVRQGADTVLF
jgi:hypothetical protein